MTLRTRLEAAERRAAVVRTVDVGGPAYLPLSYLSDLALADVLSYAVDPEALDLAEELLRGLAPVAPEVQVIRERLEVSKATAHLGGRPCGLPTLRVGSAASNE